MTAVISAQDEVMSARMLELCNDLRRLLLAEQHQIFIC